MTDFASVEHDAASGGVAGLLAPVQEPLASTPDMTKVMLKNYLNGTARVDDDWPVVAQ
jgi:hypothetical protein